MRLLNLERLELAELTATRRGLVETVSELCWFQGHGEPGRPRRVISEVLRASQGLVGDALEAVRGDELLELGWRPVKSDERRPQEEAHRSGLVGTTAASSCSTMLETIIKQFFQSGTGRSVLDQLRQQGLDDAQSRSAIAATIEGAMKASAAEGGMASQTSGLSTAAESASGISPQVAQFVAQKSGIDPTIAQKVVSIALPKVLELVQGNSIPGARPSGGGLLSALPNLGKR